ncbi:hypothetical protein [Arthrobacter methylotrophus]|uniref:hypothetical protein n=1 Tax=Arthrobacter methylotrophus TaxID=121291 RepID=UPI0031EF46D8
MTPSSKEDQEVGRMVIQYLRLPAPGTEPDGPSMRALVEAVPGSWRIPTPPLPNQDPGVVLTILERRVTRSIL